MTNQLPVLSRPRDGAVIGGVCAGLARRLGIDPTVLRVIAVAATIFFGGLGVALYVAALLLLPRDQEQFSPLTRVIPPLRRVPPVVLAVVVIALAVAITWGSGSGAVLVPAGIIAVVLWFAVFRRRAPQAAAHTPEPTPFERASAAWRVRLAEQQVPGYELSPAEQPRWEQPYTDPSDRLVKDNLPLPPAVPAPTAHSWRLWGLALTLAGVGTGLVALISIVFGIPTGPGAYLSAVLAALGITAVVASRVGRPPLLIPAIIGTAIATAIVQLPPADLSVGDYERSISSESELTPVKVSAGNVRLDLSGLDLTSDRTLEVEVGAGDVTLDLPTKESAKVDWQIGLGEVSFAGASDQPVSGNELVVGPASPSTHQLTVRVKIGAGDLAVNP
ncbi:MAG: PspC domain-containing protein [Propionicimonas sp.]